MTKIDQSTIDKVRQKKVESNGQNIATAIVMLEEWLKEQHTDVGKLLEELKAVDLTDDVAVRKLYDRATHRRLS